MSVVEYFNSTHTLIAIVIHKEAKVDGVSFLTSPENEFQIGLMTRTSNNPVKLHKHHMISRAIKGTQEFLLIRSGRAQVTIWEDDLSSKQTFILNQYDAVLLLSGCHEVVFLEPTELLEIKQGPYDSRLDKTFL